jgi:2-dehydropantoate 2-reductase
MQIVVVGAGALGGFVGAMLTESGEDVTLLEIDTSRAYLLNREGLLITEEGKDQRRVSVKVNTSVMDMQSVDLVFISVKSYQTETAVRGVMDCIGPATQVLSMQNGIGNTDVMAGILGPERVLIGITYHSIQHTGPNHMRYRVGIKPIQICPYQGRPTPEVQKIVEVFKLAGLDTEVVENIDHEVCQKLLHDAVVKPVSAITGMNCDQLLEDEDLQQLMRGLCDEIVAVMRARGVPIIDEEDPYRSVISSQKALGRNHPSMWQDLARGVRTEIDAINGAIVKEAKRLGLSAPMNEAIVRLIHSREKLARSET